ncbi:MAG TPA: DEAD/DEAH box helicase [Candidatus Polarisedimenticolaceae bacterium]|nr:DEAD/DEAH box helicase [Candidatus Polarisedimenticolaceae bacterium]
MSITFRDFGLTGEIIGALDAAGYTSPTPIQRQAIPILLEGGDLIGVAETGTGKTLAFLLPIFERLERDRQDAQALIVCPTRELALQVAGESARFGAVSGVRTVVAYGGTSSGEQKKQLAAGCDIVVGTPGRLLDFLNSAWLSVRRVRTVVLDEADRMLDMGFIADVDAILRRAPMSRQTLLFSATFPEEIRRLSQRYMFHPRIVRMHEGTRVTKNVEHVVYPVEASKKERLLFELLRRERPEKFLVFTATREATSRLALALRRQGHEVISLSSLLSQANRERALGAFRRGECSALVATDVAARGLDITDIDLVVNFDLPLQPQDYVHRVGRTGRAERAGRAVTLVTPEDEPRAARIEKLLRHDLVRLQLEGFTRPPGAPAGGRRDAGSGRSRSRGSGRGGRGGGSRRRPGPASGGRRSNGGGE